MKPYQKYSPINRPVLSHMPWWQVDVQSLPPYAWCEKCGAEVYVPYARFCPRCTRPGNENTYIYFI